MRRTARWLAAGAACALLLAAGARAVRSQHAEAVVEALLQAVQPLGQANELACRDVAAQRPLVLLAIGQSNAGNHGAAGTTPDPPLTMIDGERCVRTGNPLPGSTGSEASLWTLLPAALAHAHAGVERPVVIAAIGIEATSVGDWSREGGALRQRLLSQLEAMRRAGLPPALVLWQQGEADARQGTSTRDYQHALMALAESIRAAGLTVPMLLAQSTLCQSAPNAEIRRAIELAPALEPMFRRGPDIDALQAPGDRRDGCHFSHHGREQAARLWAASILAARPAGTP